VSKPVHGSKSSYKGVKRGYAKVSWLMMDMAEDNPICRHIEEIKGEIQRVRQVMRSGYYDRHQ
jgi:hypothetical protein